MSSLTNVTVTVFQKLTNPRGQRRTFTLVELKELCSHATAIGRVPSKKEERKGKLDPDKYALPGISFATFTDDNRKKTAVESVTALALDYDRNVQIDQAIALWGQYAGFLHTSPSHMYEDFGPRFRLILWINRPVTPAEHQILWAWMDAKCRAAGQEVDDAPKDPSRYWFLPGIVDGAPFETRELTGKVLDVDKILAEEPVPAARRAKPPVAAREARPKGEPKLPSRHESLKVIAVRLRRYGCDGAEILDKLRTHNATNFDDPKPDDELVKLRDWTVQNIPDAPRSADVSNFGGHGAFSDAVRGEEFANEHRESLRFVHESGWMEYDGNRWCEDKLAPIKRSEATHRRLAKRVVESSPTGDVGSVVSKLLKRDAINAAVSLAAPRLAVRFAAFDADPWMFNCQNGTVDLRNGNLRPHDPSDLITKLANVCYDPNATCPRWLACLERWIPDIETRAYIQRLAGYWCFGGVKEHIVPVFYGKGHNGKSTFIDTIMKVLGDYSAPIPADTLMERSGDASKHPTERARLKGLRLAAASESKENRSLDEGTVKLLSGGDKISARYMGKDFFEFDPTHKLVLITNHKPIIKGTDDGIWRRVQLIPWTVSIPESEWDTSLKEKLLTESSGILRWLIDGCIEWQRMGVAAPECVRATTQEYKAESDVIGRYLRERTTRVPTARVRASELYRDYSAWCVDEGVTPVSQTKFGRDLVEYHGVNQSKPDGQGYKCYRGIGLRETGRTEGTDGSDSDPGRKQSVAYEGLDPRKPSELSDPQSGTPQPATRKVFEC